MTKIFLDAGHGGKDSGAVGFGLLEKNLNLAIIEKIKNKLASFENVEVKLSRETDDFVELSERARMANEWGADLFLSVHINSADTDTADGFETFTYISTNDKTRTYQNALHRAILAVNGLRDRGQQTADFAVLRETTMPAILTENGFISNRGDATKLSNSDYLDRVAQGHVNGLVQFLGLVEKKVENNMIFKDVPPDHWAFEAIKEVTKEGLMSGYNDNTFNPNNQVTRAELASVIQRLLKRGQ